MSKKKADNSTETGPSVAMVGITRVNNRWVLCRAEVPYSQTTRKRGQEQFLTWGQAWDQMRIAVNEKYQELMTAMRKGAA